MNTLIEYSNLRYLLIVFDANNKNNSNKWRF